MDLIHIHTDGKCMACGVAIRALESSELEFEIKSLTGVEIKGGLPILINTENGCRFNGWAGSIKKLKEVLKIE